VVTGLRGPYVAARVLPIAFLVALLVARVSDGTAHQLYGPLPFVVAVFVLPLWYASGFAPGPWRAAPWALVGVQCLITYVPFALFGSHWVGGATGPLVGLVLLVSRRPWLIAGLLLVVEGVLWNFVVGVPYLPAVNAGIWVLDASVDNALGLYGLVRLAQVVGELRATQGDLASAAVLRERLVVGERLVGAVEERVRLVARHARAALRWLSSSPEDARSEVGAAGRVAREAISEGRRLYAGDDRVGGEDLAESWGAVHSRGSEVREIGEARGPELPPAPGIQRTTGLLDEGKPDSGPVDNSGRRVEVPAAARGARQEDPGTTDVPPVATPVMAKAVLATVLTMFSLQNLLNVFVPPAGVTYLGDPTLVTVIAVVVSAAVPVLHWRHSGPVRPRFWLVTLVALAVLCYLQFAFIGALAVIFLAFVCGSVLLVVHGPWRWVWFAAVLVSIPGLAWWAAPAVVAAWPVWAYGYTTAIVTAFGLMAYGLSRLTTLADQLAASRDQLARVATDAERLRLARDTHDLLGLGMSTLALKTDLVAALIGRDDQRAARELGEVVRLCATVGADVGRIAGERPELSLASEVATATDVLESSGIDVFADRRLEELATEVDTVLAIVLREAVTNILRHSAAQRCVITLVDDVDVVTLRITNDGAATPPGEGRGLENMRTRVEAVGGSLTTRHERGTFVVVAAVGHG
jgi:signal transduction histidine kinase